MLKEATCRPTILSRTKKKEKTFGFLTDKILRKTRAKLEISQVES